MSNSVLIWSNQEKSCPAVLANYASKEKSASFLLGFDGLWYCQVKIHSRALSIIHSKISDSACIYLTCV